MNFAQLTITIVSVKFSENEDGLSVFSGTGQFQWSTGKEEPGTGSMNFYASGIPDFIPTIGETYVLSGQARVRKISLGEGDGNNTMLNLIVKGVSRPLVQRIKADIATTKTKTATNTKAALSTKKLAAVGSDDLDSISF